MNLGLSRHANSPISEWKEQDLYPGSPDLRRQVVSLANYKACRLWAPGPVWCIPILTVENLENFTFVFTFQIGPSIRYIQHDCLYMDVPATSIKWHQDWVFWPHTNQSLVTGFLSIDDSCRENGTYSRKTWSQFWLCMASVLHCFYSTSRDKRLWKFMESNLIIMSICVNISIYTTTFNQQLRALTNGCFSKPYRNNWNNWNICLNFLPSHLFTLCTTTFLSFFFTGCLQVVPGSHKGPFYNHFIEDKFASEINDATFDPNLAVHVEVPAGGISFHHPFTVHGSAANQSNRPKRYLVFSFGTTDAWPLMGVVGKEWELWGPVDWDRYCSTVVRGKASKFPRMEALPVSLPVPFTSESLNRFYSKSSESIHGTPK